MVGTELVHALLGLGTIECLVQTKELMFLNVAKIVKNY